MLVFLLLVSSSILLFFLLSFCLHHTLIFIHQKRPRTPPYSHQSYSLPRHVIISFIHAKPHFTFIHTHKRILDIVATQLLYVNIGPRKYWTWVIFSTHFWIRWIVREPRKVSSQNHRGRLTPLVNMELDSASPLGPLGDPFHGRDPKPTFS